MAAHAVILFISLQFAVVNGWNDIFKFEEGIDNSQTCGMAPKEGWTFEGPVTLTKGDLYLWQPKVVINAVHEVCTVDLTKCYPRPSSPHTCYCKSKKDDKYIIHVGSKTREFEAKTVKASIPGQGMLNNVYTDKDIGMLQGSTEKKSPVNATFSIDDGTPSELLPVQKVKICPEKRFLLEICVKKDEGDPKAELSITTGFKTAKITGDRCVSMAHQFGLFSARSLVFEYTEPKGCSQTNIIQFEDDKKACNMPKKDTVKNQSTPKTTDKTTVKTTDKTTMTPPMTTPMTTPMTGKNSTLPTKLEPVRKEPGLCPDCVRIRQAGMCPDWPRTITSLSDGSKVLADEISLGNSWIIFQRRISGAEDFYRPWSEYEKGFGKLNESFWLGLEKLHRMCNSVNKCELLVNLLYQHKPADSGVKKLNDGCYYALYETFYLDDADSKYRLHVNGYSGTAGDSLGWQLKNRFNHDDMPFSTFDNDNDKWHKSCAERFKGGWWYNACSAANLNGRWKGKKAGSSNWVTLTDNHNSVSFTEMKVRQLA